MCLIFIFLIFLTFNLLPSTSGSKPTLLKLPSQTQSIQNYTLTLSCNSLSGTLPLKFEWYKNNEKITNSLRSKVLEQENFSVLTLKNLILDDSGKYSCLASNYDGQDSTMTVLMVQGLCFFLSFFLSFFLLFLPRVWRRCWFKIYLKFFMGLTIIFVDKFYWGYILWNPIFIFKMNFLSFLILFGLNIFVSGSSSSSERPQIARTSSSIVQISQPINTLLYLPCNVIKGSRPLKFEWSKNGHFLSSLEASNRYQIETKNSISILTIPEIDVQDSGNYSCKVSNSYGQDNLVTNLIVKGKH